MREVNFSIPNVNKASVGITTALYDRRALDCTSTLPLINSLNHLAYLTTSSARIRDILTIDGGVERLVCILKQGRSQEMMEMWKWNLAFQCVVNIGVRGSEGVRTRVVEADMVPVIATILDNYIKVIEKCREKVEAEHSCRRRSLHAAQPRQSSPKSRGRTSGSNRQSFQLRGPAGNENRPFRRQEPPPAIEIPQSNARPGFEHHNIYQTLDTAPMEMTPTLPQLSGMSPFDRPSAPRNHHHHQHHHHHHHHHHRSQDIRQHANGTAGSGSRHIGLQSLPAAVPSMDTGDGIGLRPVRDSDRLPSMLPALQTGITSQPESPTTPSAPPSIQAIIEPIGNRRRPSIRQQSNSGDSDDANLDEAASETSATNENSDEPMVDIQTTVDIQESEDQDSILEDVSVANTIRNVSEGQEAETFNITHQSANDGSIINANVTPANNTISFPPTTQTMTVVNLGAQAIPHSSHARYLLDRSGAPGILAATPRDEDVLMSLQLLAYVSKYCNLRSYFQRSHLVPKLKIREDLGVFENQPINNYPKDYESEEEEEEYLLPDDFNIFPLVEKFTVRHHSQDMQHWAGVVMRNLCRKDDARGGIRQCAYYECGRWEQWTRQFAKCRRCRRTKYCSKECQKNAWLFHRHWCQVASP
ncbi:MAG: hypothetical protein Q9217_000360 [Psora testacea]